MKNTIRTLLIILLTTCKAIAVTTDKTEKSGLIYYDQYIENKNAFLEDSKKINLKNWKLSTESWSLLKDKNLTTDLSYFENAQTSEPSTTLLVITSGIHGIEGYVGSSIQRWFIEQYIKTNKIKTDIC